jgi:hypothetical protein
MSTRRPGTRALRWLVAMQLGVLLVAVLATVAVFALGAAGTGPFAQEPLPPPTASGSR